MLRTLHFAVIALALTLSALAHDHLPPVMPIHWNAWGQADGFGPRTLAVLLVPGVMLVLLAIFALVPRLSSKGEQLRQMRGVYDGLVLSTLVFMLAVHGVMLAVGLGYPIRIERVVPFAVSLLFVAIGAFIGRVSPNAFVGVRTPWTMASPENWRATHRFAARLFVVGGLALALACLAGAGFWVVFAGFMLLGLAPVAYSLVAWVHAPK